MILSREVYKRMKRGNKVIILGGNGFIGKNLSICLLKKGYDVYSFDCTLPDIAQKGINYIQGDFFDESFLKETIKDKDIVYHGVSTINPGNSNEFYMRGYEKDFIQTVKLCKLISELSIKLIFLSSGGTIYGTQSEQPIVEEALPRPINHYGNIKLCMENTMMTFAIQANADIRIARISNPYGPGQDYTKGVGFIDAVIKKAMNGETVEVWGDGSIVRDYIYIEDTCQMLALLATYNGKERIFNLSSGKGICIKDIIEIIKEWYPQMKIKYKSKRSVDLEKIVLNNQKIMRLYNREMIEIQEGIERYYNTIKEREK
jgi:UDP-glucose 4-epimerase